MSMSIPTSSDRYLSSSMLIALVRSPSQAVGIPLSLSPPTTAQTLYWNSSWNFGQQLTAIAS